MPLYDALQGLYCVYETIGSGGFGKVKRGVHVLTGETVAIKIMNKRKLGIEVLRVQTEIEAMKQLVHQNICQLYQIIETDEDFFLILEYCPNGELFDYIVSRDHLDEQQARFFFCQIVCAVAYIHHSGYAHRDLKPENLLLDDKGNLKLIDFGLCVKPAGGMDAHVSTCCGSPAYAAPELIAGKLYLGGEADIWSLGVLLYALLCGFLPFDASNTALLYRKIQLGKYSTPPWLTSGSCDLIGKMLQTDPNVRMKMDDLIRHPWITNGSTTALSWRSVIKSDHLDEECVRVLRRYYRKSMDEMRQIIQRSHPNYLNATYKLLVKKIRGKQPVSSGLRNYVVSINVSNEEVNDDESKDWKTDSSFQRPGRPVPHQGRHENKENKKTSKISKNETFLVQRPSLPPRGVKLESADTKGFAGSRDDSRRASPVRENIQDKVYDEIPESSKQKVKDEIDKKVKWNIPKMPQANCMRGCGADVGDDNDGLRRLKCCSNARGPREEDRDEFVFTDFRKRKVGPDLVDEKERKITKTVVPAREAIYDNIVNLGLSPRTSDVLRRSRRRKEAVDDAAYESYRQSHDSPGSKLTRWKNNQRRKAPAMRFMSPDIRRSKRYPDDSNPSQTSSSRHEGSRHGADKIDCSLPSSSVKPCRRVLEWVHASSTATSTDDDDIKSLARRKLDLDSDTPESGSNKDHLKSPDGSKEARNEDSEESESLLKKSIKSTTKYDSESYRNTIECGKVLQNSSKEFSSVPNSRNSAWKSMESKLNDESIAHRRSAYALSTSASVEIVLDRIHTVARGNRNSKKPTMMENFEKGMDRLIGIFSPRKKANFQSEPRKIKMTHNVSTSNQQEANLIMQRLKDALTEKKVYFRERGFSLKCSVLDRCNQTVLSFTLEVVQINKTSLGIHRKRLIGDVWYYKRLCESVLKVAKV